MPLHTSFRLHLLLFEKGLKPYYCLTTLYKDQVQNLVFGFGRVGSHIRMGCIIPCRRGVVLCRYVMFRCRVVSRTPLRGNFSRRRGKNCTRWNFMPGTLYMNPASRPHSVQGPRLVLPPCSITVQTLCNRYDYV